MLVHAAADKLRSDSPSSRVDAPRYSMIDVSVKTEARACAALRPCPTFPSVSRRLALCTDVL